MKTSLVTRLNLLTLKVACYSSFSSETFLTVRNPWLKISDLALGFPILKMLRSCDLLLPSWISVAWYPIYRIPTRPTLKDLDACFLTYHSLHTPMGGLEGAPAPVVPCTNEMDGGPKMSLPVFGLASYKFKGSLWTPNSGGCECQVANSLMQAADNWLRLLQVGSPRFLVFQPKVMLGYDHKSNTPTILETKYFDHKFSLG